MPKMDIWLNVASNEMHYVACIIPTLKWRGGKLGVRLAFFPKDIVKLFTDYRDAYFAAREVEKAKENLSPITLMAERSDIVISLKVKFLSARNFPSASIAEVFPLLLAPTKSVVFSLNSI